jgi:hypothetical protein
MTRRYIGVEDLGMTADQRQTLIDHLKQLGANNQHPNPCNRNHWRVRLDGLAVIFEADWNTESWTVESVKEYLANLYDINPATISDSLAQTQYGPAVTYSRNGDKLRVIVFGGADSTYAGSHVAVLSFLSNNAAEWESEL